MKIIMSKIIKIGYSVNVEEGLINYTVCIIDVVIDALGRELFYPYCSV